MIRGDLHTHTHASDGALSTDDLMAHARQEGLAVIAVTDHETTAGWPPEGRRLPRVIGGVEVASIVDDQEFHLLGYFSGAADVTENLLREIREGRQGRFEAMIQKLEALGIDVRPHIQIPQGNVSLGRPHLAQALCRAGVVSTLPEAFERYLEEGAPAHVGREKVLPMDVIDAVHADQGLVTLAHPMLVKGEVPFDRLKGWGLDAIEVYHPSATPDDVTTLLEVAKAFRFLQTGGSDFHGQEGARLGIPFLPEEPLLSFLSALDRQRFLA